MEEIIKILVALIIYTFYSSIDDGYKTYKTVKLMQKITPSQQHYNLEVNPLQKILWKKFGLKKGSIIGVTIILIMISLTFLTAYFIPVYFNLDQFLILFFMIGLVLGALETVNSGHKHHLKLLKKIQLKIKEKKILRCEVCGKLNIKIDELGKDDGGLNG